MAPTYNIVDEFLGPGDGDGDSVDSIGSNPYCLIAVWRYKYPSTYDRGARSSLSIDPTDAASLKGTLLLIANDIAQMSVSTSKGSHTNIMSCTLLPGMDYLSEILPGDFVAGWMVNSQEAFSYVVEQLKKGLPANSFTSGLKFMGRISSLQKRLQQSPSGPKNTQYSLTAHGFSELDAAIYYEPHLAVSEGGLATEYLRKTGITLNDIIRDNKYGLDINKLIPIYLTAFYGNGVPKDQAVTGDLQGLTQGLDNPNAFVIPAPVAQILNVYKPSKPNGLFSYADILEVVYGVQKYDTSPPSNQLVKPSDSSSTDVLAGARFNPRGLDPKNNIRQRYTGVPMIGTYLPTPVTFNGQRTVWQIIEQYLNKTINEMYTCMRVNAAGRIMPTLVVRQIPFSSGALPEEYPRRQPGFADSQAPLDDNTKSLLGQGPKTFGVLESDANKENQQYLQDSGVNPKDPAIDMRKVDLTRMLELPRWKVHPVLVQSYSVGRSDAMRFNFIHIDPDPGVAAPNRTATFVRNPPIADQLDIARSGLRPYLASINCSPQDLAEHRPSDWMYILSDILFGQHLVLSGTMELRGIQAPIVPGDNIEFDDCIMHIESVQHNFSITASGLKKFSTSMSLTHGVHAKQEENTPFSMYAGIAEGDLSRYDAAHTSETDGVVPGERVPVVRSDIDGSGARNKDTEDKLGDALNSPLLRRDGGDFV